jgi:hypothetical protein
MGEYRMIKHNKLYGVLTDGCSGFRHTNYRTSELDDYSKQIVNTLIPVDCVDAEKAHRAELFIKLASSDIVCNDLIHTKDSYNSYNVVSYDIELDTKYDLTTIGKAIKQLQLPGEERDFGPIESIINAIKIVLEHM